MLTRNKKLVAAGIAALFAASWLIPVYGEICSKDEYTNQKDCASYHISTVILWHIGEFLNYYGGAITAVATAAIGLFTYTLYKATTEQARLTREGIELGNKEFIASHRPIIVIHSVETALEASVNDDETRIGASIFYVNTGSTPARIVSIYTAMTRRRLPLQSGIRMDRQPDVPEKLEGGERSYIRLDSDYRLEFEAIQQRTANTVHQPTDQTEGRIFCLGCIVYEDDRGVRRETGFCRQFDAIAERWIIADAPEYEYAY